MLQGLVILPTHVRLLEHLERLKLREAALNENCNGITKEMPEGKGSGL